MPLEKSVCKERVNFPQNDPSSATRRTGGNDCNPDVPAGLNAASRMETDFLRKGAKGTDAANGKNRRLSIAE